MNAPEAHAAAEPPRRPVERQAAPTLPMPATYVMQRGADSDRASQVLREIYAVILGAAARGKSKD